MLLGLLELKKEITVIANRLYVYIDGFLSNKLRWHRGYPYSSLYCRMIRAFYTNKERRENYMTKISETLKYGLESILFGENLFVRR